MYNQWRQNRRYWRTGSPHMKCLSLFVHAVNTSGLHQKERRALKHSTRCLQCGALVGAATHVAAHVTEYRWPIFCLARGTLTLITTCKRCNGLQQERGSVEPCCYPRARFWVCLPPSGPNLARVWLPWCYRHHVPSDELPV